MKIRVIKLAREGRSVSPSPSCPIEAAPSASGVVCRGQISLGRIFRIPVFGMDLRVRTALAVLGDNLAGRSELVQPLLKSGPLHRQFASQFRDYLFMELPQVIDGHRFQIAVFHWTPVREAGRHRRDPMSPLYIFENYLWNPTPQKM